MNTCKNFVDSIKNADFTGIFSVNYERALVDNRYSYSGINSAMSTVSFSVDTD